MSAQPSENVVRMPKPVWMKIEEGDSLTLGEWISWYIGRHLSNFRRQCRVSPKLRERCVDYAIRSGCTGGSWNVTREANDLAEYIATGKR